MRVFTLAVMIAFCAAAQAEVILRCPPILQGARNSGAGLTDGPPEELAILAPNNPGAAQLVWDLGPAVWGRYYLVCQYGRASRASGHRTMVFPIEQPVSSCRFDMAAHTLTCK